MANGYGYVVSGEVPPSKLCEGCDCCGVVPGTGSPEAAVESSESTLIASGQFTFRLPLLTVAGIMSDGSLFRQFRRSIYLE